MAKNEATVAAPRSNTKLFMNNNARSVRFAKAVDFPAAVDHVTLVKQGRGRLVLPSDEAWDDFFEREGLGGNFLSLAVSQ